jgi:hypothetical protein
MAAGWQLCYLDDVVAHHHPSAARLGADRRRSLQLRNAILTTWLRRPVRAGISEAARLACLGVRDGAARRALAGAMRRLPSVLYQRRPIPAVVELWIRDLEKYK